VNDMAAAGGGARRAVLLVVGQAEELVSIATRWR
jgi:hypothetical protein